MRRLHQSGERWRPRSLLPNRHVRKEHEVQRLWWHGLRVDQLPRLGMGTIHVRVRSNRRSQHHAQASIYRVRPEQPIPVDLLAWCDVTIWLELYSTCQRQYHFAIRRHNCGTQGRHEHSSDHQSDWAGHQVDALGQQWNTASASKD